MKLDPHNLPRVATLAAELVHEHDSILGESPLWEEREQVLYWVDIDRGQIHRFDPAGRENTTHTLDTKVTSIGRRASGDLIAALRKNLAYVDPATGRIQLFDAVEADQPENRFNDGKCDRRGRFWAGTMNEVHIGEPVAGLYRFQGPGAVKKMVSAVTISNGTGWSPDGRTMYYTDTLRYTVFAYDFDTERGEIGNPQVFYETDQAANGLPDGLTVDAEGFVWSALVNYGRVLRFDPEGRLERMVSLPATRGTCCAFGGADYGDHVTGMQACV